MRFISLCHLCRFSLDHRLCIYFSWNISWFKKVQGKINLCDTSSTIHRYLYRQSSILTLLILYAFRAILRLVFILRNHTICNMQKFLMQVRTVFYDLVNINFIQEQATRGIFGTLLCLTSTWGQLINNNKLELNSFYKIYVSNLLITM